MTHTSLQGIATITTATSLLQQRVRNNNLVGLQWLVNTYPHLDIPQYNEWALQKCYKHGYLAMAQWIIARYPETIIYTDNVKPAIKADHIHVVQWLCNIYINIDYRCCFRLACNYDALLVAQWMSNTYPQLDILIDANDRQFYFSAAAACAGLCVAQWLSNAYPIHDVHQSDELIFRNTCANGTLVNAQWLLANYPDIDIYIADADAFYSCCHYGVLETVQWLCSQIVDITKLDNDQLFIRACYSGNLVLVDWLLTTYHIDIHANKCIAFIDACNYYKWPIAQRLCDLAQYDDTRYYVTNGIGYIINTSDITLWRYIFTEDGISIHYRKPTDLPAITAHYLGMRRKSGSSSSY